MDSPGWNASGLSELIAALQAANDAGSTHWWGVDSALKYLEIRIDTRDLGFLLRDRRSNIIEPLRVHAAIEKHRDMFRSDRMDLPVVDPNPCHRGQSQRSGPCPAVYSGACACERRAGHSGRCRCGQCGRRYAGLTVELPF